MTPEQFQYIPEEFYSFETGAPFEKCIECSRDLVHTEYFIEKAFRTYPGYRATDVIFELAICSSCADQLRKGMSEDSMAKLAAYMRKNADAGTRMQVMNDHPEDPEKWTEQCLVTGKRKSEVVEYQVYAHCQGTRIILDMMPYMISGPALDEMSELLSNKTLGEMDDFMGRHFGPPSLEKDLPKRRTILV